MNTITFDHSSNCNIKIFGRSVKISYLTNPLFDNSADALKKDIANCRDNFLKDKLDRFLNDLENGRFQMMDYENNTQDICEDRECSDFQSDIEIVEEDRVNGGWMAICHNIRAEHSGFWYAAMNVPLEIQNIKDYAQILSAYSVFADNVAEIIGLIRNSDSQSSTLNELLKFGLSEFQARAILGFKLNSLVLLEKNKLEGEIDKCTKLIDILNEYVY